ncbi:MAG: hypothetical protein ACT4P7_20800 [Gemmatimonadaceae bacterium]
MATSPPPPSPRAHLPRGLHDLVVEMAIAVHKRSIYPPGHPILDGASESVHARLAALLQTQEDLSVGVADRQLVIDGIATEDDHPLAEFAARLAGHQVGAVRIVPGVTRDELDALLGAVSLAADETVEPLGRRGDASSAHITVFPIAFERLGMLSGDHAAIASGHEDVTWRALAAAAMGGAAMDGDALDPRRIAAAIDAGSGDAAFDQAVIERLSSMLDELSARGAFVPVAQRQRLSDLVANIGARALTRLLDVGGSQRSERVVRTANDVLGTRAVIELVRAASSTDAVSISGSMLRMLQKLSSHTQLPGARGGDAERVLRMSIRRLLDGWALDNPNPEMYERVLEDAAAPAARRVADLRHDVAEPERMVDLAIETQYVGPTAEAAVGRLAIRDGIAGVLERLQLYAPSSARELLVDRLLNEASLREYLAQDALDVPLLRQAVDRMKGRAIAPLLAALDRRPDGDAPPLAELLARVGWDVLEPLGVYIASASPRMMRHLVTVFDRLDAWPPQTDPASYATHVDVLVRREAIKFMLKGAGTREAGVIAALRDLDVRIFSLGLHAASRDCSLAAARLTMARYSDPMLAPELRVRAIRAVGASGQDEALSWLGALVITRRWILGSPRLRKASPETLEAVVAISTNFPGADLARQVSQLAADSRMPEYRRAVARAKLNVA